VGGRVGCAGGGGGVGGVVVPGVGLARSSATFICNLFSVSLIAFVYLYGPIKGDNAAKTFTTFK
jgi:hypothetical protein